MNESDTKKYFESYEKVLLAWTRIKDLKNGYLFKKYSKLIIDSFIKSRLIDDDLGQFDYLNNKTKFNLATNADTDSIDDDITEDDFNYYKDVLFAITEFARCIPEYVVPLLSK